MAEDMTKAQAALLVLLEKFDPRYITKENAVEKGLGKEFNLVLRAGLIKSAGFETTVDADDWLNHRQVS